MKNYKLLLCGVIILLFSCSNGFSQNQETDSKTEVKANPQAKNNEQNPKVLTYVKVVHFTVKQERVDEFIKWIKENQDDFARSLPPGWKFIGCYVTAFHIGKHTFQFRYEIQGMGAYDSLVSFKSKKLDQYWDTIYGFINRQIPMETEIIRKVNSDNKTSEKEK